MKSGSLPRIIAASFALAAFSVAIVAGMSSGNGARAVLIGAIVSMAACYLVGVLIGAVVQHTIGEHLARYRAEHPMPQMDAGGGEAVSLEEV